MGSMPSDKPASTNPLARFTDELVGEATDAIKQTATDIAVTEPKQILESLLGSPTDTGGEQGIESTGGSPSDPQQAQALAQKQLADKQKSQKHIDHHRQFLQEQIEHHQKVTQEEDIKKQQEEQQEEEQKKQQIIQLKRERSQSIQLNAQTQGRQGSHEFDNKKGF